MKISDRPYLRHWIFVIDALLILTTGGMFFSESIVLLFHLIFLWLSIGAFFWNLRSFVIRSVCYVPLTTAMVLHAILLKQTQQTEIIEIPLLTTILVIVFLIASRRSQTQNELETKNIELQSTLNERNSLQEALARRAFYDPLTGLANRALFYDRLQQALTRASRYHGVVTVLFLDLDGFKSVNDKFGHASGDNLLVDVAERLLSQVRSEDTIARMGGDEFTVLLANVTSIDGATRVAKKLLEGISVPFVVDGDMVTLSASIGIAISASEKILPDELIRQADNAMYQVKTSGKSNYKIFTVD